MKKKKLKKPGPKPLLPHEVRTVAASSLDKTGSYSCPSSAGFAGTKFDTRMSSSAAVYAVTMSDTCKDSPCVNAKTKSDTSMNSPAMMYAATKSDTGKKRKNTELHHDSQNSPQDHTSYGWVYWNKQHGIWEYDLPPPPPDTTPSYMGGAAQSPSSSHPSHHDTVVDESLSRMSTDSPQRSSKVIDEESSSKQPSMSTADTSVNTVNMYTSNAYMSLATSVYTDPNTTYSRHTDSANNCNSRHTKPADIPALNNAWDVWGELSPDKPGPIKDPTLRNTGGTARSPSSHPSHHDKVVDETPSGSKVNEESIMEQPTKTNTVNILMEALQELATVHGLLLGADQDKLYSPDIMKAAMTELTSVTCLLQDNLQKCQNQQDSSSCLKGGGGNNYTTHSSSNNTETTSPISYSHPDKVVDINSNTVSSLMTSSPDTKLKMLEFSYSHHDKVVDIDPRQEANSQEDSALQILPSAPRQHSLPATIYKVCTENQPNYSNLVTYKDLVYMLEDMFDDSYRISLSEDISQSVLSYTQNTMPVPEAAFTYSNQTKMNETVPYQDLVLYSQPEPSPHLQCPEEELLNYVMPENQDSRFLQSPRGGGHSHHTFQRYSSSPTACCPHFRSACRLAPAAQIYRSHRSDHSTCYLPCYLSWQSS